jgi:hypothetical protein
MELRDETLTQRVEPFRSVQGDEQDSRLQLIDEHVLHVVPPRSALSPATREAERRGKRDHELRRDGGPVGGPRLLA